MQASTSGNKTGPSGYRGDISILRQYQAGLFRIGLSGSERREPSGIPAGGPTFSHLLAKELSNKSPFIPQQSSADELTGLIKSIDKCLSIVPGYKDKKVWSNYPSLIELADHMLAEVKRIIPSGFHWMIVKDDNGSAIIRYAKSVKWLDDSNIIPLEFLPELKKKNAKLHLIIVGVVYKIARACGLCYGVMAFDDYFLEDPGSLENYDDDEEGLNIAKGDILKYAKGGIVQQYIKEMKHFETYYSDEETIELILNFRPKGAFEKEVKNWLKLAVGILKDPPTLANYVINEIDPDFDAAYDDGDKLHIHNIMGFAWSFYDRVAKNREDWTNDIYGNFGMDEFGVYGEYNTLGHIKPYPEHHIMPLLTFMKTGKEIYFNYFDKELNNFYDKRDNQPRDN